MSPSVLPNRVLLAAIGALLVACADDATNPRPLSDANSGVSTQSVNDFGIQISATDDQAVSAATNGTSYMVGLTTGDRVKWRTVSLAGVPGALQSTNREGDEPMLAFDGTNYLMVWNDRAVHNTCTPQPCVPPPDPTNIRGLFLTAAGAKIGSSFAITTGGTVLNLGGIAFGGGKYLVVWTFLDVNTFSTKISARFVSPGGVLGSPLTIGSGGITLGLNAVATDGTDFLTTWSIPIPDFTTIRARLIRGDGSMATATTVDASPAPSNNPLGVAYSGGKYMVVWNDSIGLHESNVYGRLLTTAGAVTGGRITVDAAAGEQVGTGVAGTNAGFFVTWMIMAPDPANSSVRGRFFSSAGAPVGGFKGLFVSTGTGQIVATPPPVVIGNSFLFLKNLGLPGADPQDFKDLNTWDLRGSIKTLAP